MLANLVLVVWIITGGAGYIGAHVVRALLAKGLDAVVIDDLSTGLVERLPEGVKTHQLDVLDTVGLVDVLQSENVQGVMHLAAKKSVEDSVKDPLFYWHQNVAGFRSVLAAAAASHVGSIVLSSSSSVYGEGSGALITEDSPADPVNPYGDTKLACERMLRAFAVAHQVRWISLRYFNVAGTAPEVEFDRHSRTLLPLVLGRLAAGLPPLIFGDDYPTRDGTCIRDYVHVVDLANAHVAAALRVESEAVNAAFNIGRGAGVSVLEVVDAARRITRVSIEASVLPRRPGDAAEVVGGVERAQEQLSWSARLGLDDMITSEWAALGQLRGFG